MTTMQATRKQYKCGGCHGYHASLADVKACCLSGAKLSDYDEPTTGPTAEQFAKERAAIISGPPATDRQRAFILSLIEERPMAANVENIHPDKVPTYTKAEASNAIKNLLGHPKETGAVTTTTTSSVYAKVPEGHYAVDSATGNNDTDFFRVDKPTEGRWAGRTFVKRVVGGKPDFGIRGDAAVKVLERIVDAGIQEAALRYGIEIGRCCRCNRHLTDEASRAFGMGPDCRSKVGW